MKYEYYLNKEAKKKYQFDVMECNGWLGIYSHNSNKYWRKTRTGYIKSGAILNDNDIDFITNNSTCKEY